MMRPRVNTFVRLSAILVGGIFAQALVGAMVTKSDLLPNWVAVHYLLSTILVAVATVLWDRSTQHHARSVGKTAPRRPTTISPLFERAFRAFTTVVVLVSGPMVHPIRPTCGRRTGPSLGVRPGLDHAISQRFGVAFRRRHYLGTRFDPRQPVVDGPGRRFGPKNSQFGAHLRAPRSDRVHPILHATSASPRRRPRCRLDVGCCLGNDGPSPQLARAAPAAGNDARSVAPMPVAATEGT